MAPRLPARCWRQLSLVERSATHTTTTAASSLLLAGRTTPTFSASSPSTVFPSLLPQIAKRGVKYGWSTLPKRSRPTRFNQVTQGLPAPTSGPAAALKRREKTTPLRTGVLAVKKGMTVFMGRTGARIPCTVLQLDRVQVVANKTRAKNGYWAVQVGLGERRAENVGAPQLGYYEAKGIPPKQTLAEFKVRNQDGLLPVGVQLFPDWFHVGQVVDVRGITRGMGFAGGMKRHGFAGQEASHGNSLNHRTIGSVGGSQGSGSRVLPGKKMPGRMGAQQHTVQNLPILMVDNELGIVVVKGAVAGHKGAVVKVQDAVKKAPPPEEFVEATKQLLNERFPDAEEKLQAARKLHLELKEARRQGLIDSLIKNGLTEKADGNAAVEASA
ncbi:translation protein [Neurospora tetrasperma FGSC 2509]|nr:translation protein [Neurospora tetrasperma FGSC 2509]